MKKSVKPDSEEEQTEPEDDLFEIFDVLHNSIDHLQDRFQIFLDKPDVAHHAEFDKLIVEFIQLARELKNMTKSMLPKSERFQKNDPIEQPKNEVEKSTSVILDTDETTKNEVKTKVPKKRGRKPKPKVKPVTNS